VTGSLFRPRRSLTLTPQKEHHISEPRINERIRVPEVRLVGPNGEQVGIVRVEDALRLAAEADLDLVEVAPMARPPVAKLMDFGKFKYEAALKAREARKNQVNTVIKEIKLRPKIDPHDYGTKKGHVERFLKAGDKVKVTIMFRGREQSRPELGFRLLQRLAEDINELGYVESSPKQDGRNMVMVLGPTRKKADARAEQRRRRESGSAPVAHDEPMDLDDLTHLADEVQEPEVTETTEVTDAPAPAEPAAAPAASTPAPAASTPAPAASTPAPAASPQAPAPSTPTPAPSAPTKAASAPTKAPSAPTKATPAKAAPAASAPSAPATATPAAPTPRPTPRPAPRPAPPTKTTTSAESA
jgi:translation initiation factor IF-3